MPSSLKEEVGFEIVGEPSKVSWGADTNTTARWPPAGVAGTMGACDCRADCPNLPGGSSDANR